MLHRAASAAARGARRLSQLLRRAALRERRHSSAALDRRAAADSRLALLLRRLRPAHAPRHVRSSLVPARDGLPRRARTPRVALLLGGRRLLSRERAAHGGGVQAP